MIIIKNPTVAKSQPPHPPNLFKRAANKEKSEWLKFSFPLHFLSGQGVNEDKQIQSAQGQR
jgi:hypothetical protein